MKWSEIIAGLPNESGVYSVWAGDLLLYIGMGVSLSKRFQSHHRAPDFMDNGATKIRFLLVEDHCYEVEQWLIRKHRPILNKPTGRRPTAESNISHMVQ